MSRLPPGSAKESIKSQALRVLQQKKQYEQQRGLMMQQSFNMEQAAFAIDNSKATLETVAAMKQGAKEMKQAYKKLNLDKVEDVQDELTELMAESAEVQEVFGRSYGVPGEYVDEADLEAELAGLGELEAEGDLSYLDSIKTPQTGDAEKNKPEAMLH